MKYLLDTHILIWWYMDAQDLPHKYFQLLDTAEKGDHQLGLSVISLWEIAKLCSLNRISFSVTLDSWFQELEQDPLINILPINGSIILESLRLGESFHKDPADQLIVGTARHYGLKLLSVDGRIQKSGTVVVV